MRRGKRRIPFDLCVRKFLDLHAEGDETSSTEAESAKSVDDHGGSTVLASAAGAAAGGGGGVARGDAVGTVSVRVARGSAHGSVTDGARAGEADRLAGVGSTLTDRGGGQAALVEHAVEGRADGSGVLGGDTEAGSGKADLLDEVVVLGLVEVHLFLFKERVMFSI